MGAVAGMLSGTYSENVVPVADKTGIKGVFNFHLVLPIPSAQLLRSSPGMPHFSSPAEGAADLRGVSGSLEKQTGLRLKAVKVALRTMVIDSVARTPTEN